MSTLAQYLDLGRRHEAALVQARCAFSLEERFWQEKQAAAELRAALDAECLSAREMRWLCLVLEGMARLLAKETPCSDAEQGFLDAAEHLIETADHLDEAEAFERQHRPTPSQQRARYGLAVAETPA